MGRGDVVEPDDLDRRVEWVLLGEGDHLVHLRERSPHGGEEAGLVGNVAEAERDAAAVQPHDDDHALSRDVIARGGEGRLGSHEVDDGREGALDLSRCSDRVRSEAESEGLLLGGRIDHRDLGIGPDAQPLEAELPEPAGADDERPGATGGGEDRQRVVDRPVGRQPAAGQGRGMRRVEVAEGDEVLLAGNGDPLGVPAVAEQPGLGGIRADHLLRRSARPAVRLPAAPAGVHQHRAQSWVQGGDLVAEHDGQRGGVVARGGMEVRVADPAGEDVDDRASRRRHGLGDVLDGEGGTGGGEDDGAHGSPSGRSGPVTGGKPGRVVSRTLHLSSI